MGGANLFHKTHKFLHGGDYNPEQWLGQEEILEEDIKLMKKAGINVATLGVFAWSSYEPEEGTFHFDWLLKIMDNLYQNGIWTILATPTGARPAWLDEKYPQAMRVSAAGVRDHHGVRHNHCMSSLIYREKVASIIEQLARRAGNHPGLLLWHVSNEFGGECYCDLCAERFRTYLRTRFHDDISELNHEWWTMFWSHKYNSFDQIEPPYTNGENSINGLTLEWKRFNTWNMTDYMKWEIEILRRISPDIPITTNFMRLYKPLDYYQMSKELDIISWDSYPEWHNDVESLSDTAFKIAFDHSVMRSFKREKPFLLMESTPSQVNWQKFNKLKRPGMHMLACLQAVACGSDMVGYFQWRKSRGSYEQYHGAVVDHLGSSDTRVFHDVEAVGECLENLESITGSIVKTEVAMIFDWNNRWAIENMAGLSVNKNYEDTCRNLHSTFLKNGIELDVISSEADYSPYKVLIAPMLYLLKPGIANQMKAFTKGGGILIATYLTGYVNENTLCYLGGFPGDGLMDLFGLYTEEIDALYPKDYNGIHFEGDFLSGTYGVTDFCEIIKCDTAKVLGHYTEDFYANTPAVTVNSYGKGYAYYIGGRMDQAGMGDFFKRILEEVGIPIKALPEDVEYHHRVGELGTFDFYFNYSGEVRYIKGITPGIHMLTGEKLTEELILKPYDVAVVHCGI